MLKSSSVLSTWRGGGENDRKYCFTAIGWQILGYGGELFTPRKYWKGCGVNILSLLSMRTDRQVRKGLTIVPSDRGRVLVISFVLFFQQERNLYQQGSLFV